MRQIPPLPAPTTPREITPEIRALCAELVPRDEPRYVDVRPVDDAAVGDCFPVVARQVERKGGSVCYGWRIWELKNVFIEAEFHGVWRDPYGRLVDITPLPPRLEGLSRILFIPDPNRVYEGRQVNNARRAVIDKPAVRDFIRACDDSFELMNRGARAEQHGKIALEGAERDEWIAIEKRKAEALAELLRTLPTPGRNDPCFCGSAKKFKKCHGR